jgi:hypothetical protein
MRAAIIAIAISMLASIAHAEQPESYYQHLLCDGVGKMEYRLPDGTRVDCLTETHAWEVDFQHKWAEAFGQALHYARMTGREPAVLLVGDNADKYAGRIIALTKAHGIRILVVTVKP